MRPRAVVRSKLAAVKAAIDFQPGCVAVHVRAGDACWVADMLSSRAKCAEVHRYMELVKDMVRVVGPSSIFVSTDDSAVLSSMRNIAPGLRVVTNHLAQSNVLNSSLELDRRLLRNLVDRRYVSEATLIDMLLLASCDSFVGSLDSQMSRVALMLMSARLGRIPHFASVNNPWGHNDRVTQVFLSTHLSPAPSLSSISSALHSSGWDVAAALRLLGDDTGAEEFKEHVKSLSSGA
jgi:hypothetical protein